ncbi:MAG TPA: 3-phosphoshikimate 1-carboxyvinyltransferase [Candidatus Paceibacterota bacterium]|nr:3-phosphoshikimate 1-carboxyvinyltransferase [Verrucomicrobiota bacterium]HRZ45521.1 3-phosphoshikimate 1-carboxyvinyltransferase [Candidatus Paceibacterota bacterium]
MGWPDWIEIIPLAGPVSAQVTVPGSKSITNRALVLAALAEGETILEGALWSEDTRVMAQALQAIGFRVAVESDPAEPANRTITVVGQGGRVPAGGTPENPRDLFVGNAGTAARFLTALVCLGQGVYRLRGVPRMHERPQAGLLAALRHLGYRIDAAGDRLPLAVHGGGPRPGACRVSVAQSSQFASALLLCAEAGGWSVRIEGDHSEEQSYIEMTRQMAARFPRCGGRFRIEPDASSGSYFWAANAVLEPQAHGWERIQVRHWPDSGWQVDARFPRFWPLPAEVSRARDLGDSIMTAIVLAPWAGHPVRFTDLGRLRVQECERVIALRAELGRCGARVTEVGDTLTVEPGLLHGAEIETYQDHRMAMAFTILGLKIAGIKIKNPACVQKTFPNFFAKLAALPPAGLGAGFLEGGSGSPWPAPPGCKGEERGL